MIEAPRPRDRVRALLPALILSTLVVYQPVWHGGLLWDDDGHLTAVHLRSADGLRRIWFELGATQQYYPLTHSVFWLQHRLWGDHTTGYHLVNIVLHSLSAVLLVLVLRRLRAPGAVLAGALFALHPVHVESVAWISELKNTLSGVLYLAAALAYLHFDERRSAGAYAGGLTLFVLALSSKTVTATLPAALLVVFWWKRGRVSWRRDVRPLLPFFAVAAAAGLLTIWVERMLIGARGAEFELTVVERALVAGRAIWFYLASLAWPANLMFNYPRWDIDASDAAQFVYPAAALILAGALWRFRRLSRAPLAAFLIFCGTLVPVLGFVDVYPFRYAYVADHFQYLASIPVIALAAAGLTTIANGMRRRLPVPAAIAPAALAVVLGALSWRQAHQYADVETLYRTTIARNPSSWLAHANLGTLKLETSPGEAVEHLAAAVRLRPDVAQTRVSLGYGLQRLGRLTDAMAEYQRAVTIDPAFAEAHNNICSVLHQTGRLDEAITACLEALRLAPGYAKAHFNLGIALGRAGRPESIGHLREAVRLDPTHVDAHVHLADRLQVHGQLEDASNHFAHALRLAPGLARVHDQHGYVLQRLGRFQEALAEHEAAVRLEPGFAAARNNLAGTLQQLGRVEEAIAQFREAVRVDPSLTDAQFNLANALQRVGRPSEALPHYRAVLRANPNDASAHVNLGVALQSLGRLDEAIQEYRIALRLRPDSAEARENLARALASRVR